MPTARATFIGLILGSKIKDSTDMGRKVKRGAVMGAVCAMALWALSAGCFRGSRDVPPPPTGFVFVPGGRCEVGKGGGTRGREVEVAPFWLGAHEVSVADYVTYCNLAESPIVEHGPQVARRETLYVAVRGQSTRPVTHISRSGAEAYCAWLSDRKGLKARLPTEDEWEVAARGGVRGAPYPWGWGEPSGRACFSAVGPAPCGTYPPNPFGLHDMAGNVYEWCRDDDTEKWVARGGSWAERVPGKLAVFSRDAFEPGYRDADVGFRVLVELTDAVDPSSSP